MKALSSGAAAFGLAISLLVTTAPAQDSATTPVPESPSIRPEFDLSVPVPSEANSAATTAPAQPFDSRSADQTVNDAMSANESATANSNPTAAPTPPAQDTSSPSRRRVRLARAPNMFGDFFNAPPTLSFVVPQISFPPSQGDSPGSPEILSPTSGFVQNPMIGGGPRLKISDNFSPIPRSRFFVQEHYFHNLFGATLTDVNGFASSGELNTRESVFVTTVGAEFLSEDEKTSIEFRLPLIHAPSINSTLIASAFGPVASQSSSNNPVGNLSLILKHVISEDRNYLMSGGIGVSLPTASDVTGNLAHVNYEVQNDTLNLIPFIAILFSPRNDVFIQLHSQIDVPIGNDNFAFTEQPLPYYTAQSGTFGSYRESVLASMDIQTGCRLFSNPHSRSIRGVTAIVELRYTAALNDSSGAAGQAGEFYGDPATQVSAQLSQTSNRQDYLNMTFGIQLDIRNDWHLRCGQVFPLIDSNSFTAETLLQLERRF
jgi:hypothetical protein